MSIVALSGGADSVALLLGLLHLGQPLVAAHCNFHLRGKESDADEAFVRQVCEARGVTLFVEHFDTATYAKQQRISIEMAARELRYDYFEKLRTEIGASDIVVAHHQDDNVETLLLNLVRGSGLKGLCGMQSRNGFVVRPLLDVTRKEIEDFLKSESCDFRVDSTNDDTAFKRNKIRHELLPLLRELNPSVDRTLASTIQRLKEAQCQIESQRVQTSSDSLSLSELKSSSIPQTLVFEFLAPYGFTSAQCRQIAKGCSERVGAMYESAEYLCVRDRSELVVGRKPYEIDSLEIPMGREKIELPNRGFLCLKRCKKEDFRGIPQASNVACLDLHHITFPLFVRTPREGDRFTPFGMKGTQLISDYLTDRKRNRIEKRSALLLSDAQGPIWLMNERPDQRVVITEKTQEVLLIEWVPKS